MNLVDAQQTRRMLDRMVGYRISPLLWEKIKRGLECRPCTVRCAADYCGPRGRNQCIYSGRILDIWMPYLQIPGEKKPLTAKVLRNGKREDDDFIQKKKLDHDHGRTGRCRLSGGRSKKGRDAGKKAPLPFTTSTLQQEASKALNFSTQKTMRLAQQLYEGVDIKGQRYRWSDHLPAYRFHPYFGRSRCSSKSLYRRTLRRSLCGSAGEQTKKNGKKIQDAHEAIRPTDITRTPAMVKESLHQRPVPSVSADLETICGKPYAAGCIRNNFREDRRGGEYLFTVCRIQDEV